MAEGPVVVFAGPSLPAAPDGRWRDLLDRSLLRPPARRGDLLAVLPLRPRAIVLLDGYWFRVPAVSHKEILYSLADGVRLLGAASMGALRAAELASFGMEPVGRIARRFLAGELEGDDEVALLHEERAPYRPLTEALVDVRAALDECTASGEVSPVGARRLLRSLKRLPFGERTRTEIRRLGSEHLSSEATDALLGELATHRLKEEDARRALERAFEPCGEETPPQASRFTGYLEGFLEESLTVPVHGPGPVPTLRDAWRTAQLLHPDVPRFVERESGRFARAAVARELGTRPDPAAVAEWSRAREAGHRDRFGRPVLPPQEYRRAAEIASLAAALEEREGWRYPAASLLGVRPEETDRALAELSPLEEDLAPAAWIARAFAFTEALAPAAEAASAAEELRRAHEALRGPLAEASLRAVACEIWGVGPDGLPAAARARELRPAGGPDDPLLEASRRIAVAHRLPRSLNRYPEWREALARAPLLDDSTKDRSVPA